MSLAQVASVVRQALSMEAENLRRYDVPLTRRLWLYRHRFTSSRDAMYDLSAESVDDYVSDLQNARAKGLNRPNAGGLKNTVFFHMLISRDYPDLAPAVHAVVTRDGRVAPVPGGEIDDLGDLVELARSERVVVKPIKHSGGTGVHILGADGDQLLFDGEPVTEAALADRLASLRPSVVEEYVEQAAYAREIYPDAANTIRVMTMVDPDTLDPFVAAAAHRFGGADSGFVDNWHSGGISAGIDMETGRLGRAVVSEFAESGGWTDSHPDTGAEITGTTIPSWTRIRERLLDVAREYRGLWPYVGWDLVVTDDDGGFVLLEGNDWPGVDVVQPHKPLLSDDRVHRFYEHHGVV